MADYRGILNRLLEEWSRLTWASTCCGDTDYKILVAKYNLEQDINKLIAAGYGDF